MKILKYGLVLAVTICTAGPAQAGPDGNAARWLASHNEAREGVMMDPLVWDEGLATDAASWAQHLADSNTFEHAHHAGQGENLWRGTRGAFTPEDMVGGWVAEGKYWRGGTKFPDVSKTGNWADVGHFTQVIWGRTKRVGCAVAHNAAHDVFVCRYSPPGNVMGQEPANFIKPLIKN
jgi:hypothetical protein